MITRFVFNLEVNDGGELFGDFEVEGFILALEGLFDKVENEGHGFFEIRAMEFGVMKLGHR